MRSLELFSGAGGLAKGLELSGFEHIGFVENNRHACSTLKENFNPEFVFHGDIRDYEFEQFENVDLIAGGPPCQPFSIGGKHKASSDDRDMFPYAIKAIQTLVPRGFIFENVKGLLRPSFSKYFDYIKLRLSYPDNSADRFENWEAHYEALRVLNDDCSIQASYEVYSALINSANYGIPQTRERVIIVGLRKDLNATWSFPAPTHTEDRLIWDQYVSKEYWRKHEVEHVPLYKHSSTFENKIRSVREKYGMIPPDGKPWSTIRDALINVPDPAQEHEIPDHVFRGGAKSYPGHTGSLFDLPSKTIKAGVHGVPGGENMIRFSNEDVRYLTVHEAKLLQSFPESFQISGAWGEAMRQIGNAVPVRLAELFGVKLNGILANDQGGEAKAKSSFAA